MKKLFTLLLTTVLCACCFASCDMFGKTEGLTYDKYENCAVFSFDSFEGKETIKLERTNLGEGVIYYQANLEKGTLNVKYEYVGVHVLAEFSANDNTPVSGSGGYVEGDKIAITFECDSLVSGEIIIAFAEDALIAVGAEIKLHEHTFVFEANDDAHKLIYTCDCEWLEVKNFEPHYDEDLDAYCDLCEYHIGLPHEHSSWFEIDEASHRRIFACGCESSETYEPHVDNDNDDWCDVCGYGLNRKEQLFIDNVIELSAKGESLTWSDFAQYECVETGSGLYILLYDIDDTFQLIIGGNGNTEETPMYIRLALKIDIDTYVDVRSGMTAVKAFYEANSN